MSHRIRCLEWKRADDQEARDVTDALSRAVLTPTPHPDDSVDRPKGYTLKLTLNADSHEFATELQEALLDVDSPTVSIELVEAADPIRTLAVNVSKVPYPGEQNEAELGVKPEDHDRLHAYV